MNRKDRIMKETEFRKAYNKKRELRNLKAAEEKIEIFWETLVEALKEEGRVLFKGWGSFEIKEMKKRTFNNPRTKKAEKIPECKKIIFRQGKLLKKRFNKEDK